MSNLAISCAVDGRSSFVPSTERVRFRPAKLDRRMTRARRYLRDERHLQQDAASLEVDEHDTDFTREKDDARRHHAWW